ncbi:hypothetical protein NX059_002391 [Plenodomus lindquistii]|nr:hypothetical protein NX059_002391 [Plenodomus lindquistii]
MRPFLRFDVTPEALVADTNEDGFTRANIEAICATGQSSKKATTSDNQIGEKGFGFKSVFSVANMVHIQSGVWSFQFRHNRGDDGIGMVTPLEAPPEVLPTDVTTRITLHLTDKGGTEYEDLLDAIFDMPETTIFFLRNLGSLRIRVAKPGAVVTETTFRTQKQSFRPEMRNLVKSHKGDNGSETHEVSAYRIFGRNVDNLPADDRRKTRSARIELAFPITSTTNSPELDDHGHYVFSFLPLQQYQQLHFLIQSDFITSANRESIVQCPWNDAIRNGVANVFADAVLSFVKDDGPMKYLWLDYLPTTPMSGSWKYLYKDIKEILKGKAVIQTREKRQLQTPANIRFLSQSAMHGTEPILADLPTSQLYIAPEYAESHQSILTELGVSRLTWREFLPRLMADLSSTHSRLRTKDLADPWHDTFAAALLGAWGNGVPDDVQLTIKKLALIPLTQRRGWTGAPGLAFGGRTNIYFPTTSGIKIPTTIPLDLVDETAARSVARRLLYRKLGVQGCAKEVVFEKIKLVHSGQMSRQLGSTMTTQDALHAELWYLFNLYEDVNELRSWVTLPTEFGDIVAAKSAWYLTSRGEYDVSNLVDPETRKAAGNSICLIGKHTLDWKPSTTTIRGRTWRGWLQELTAAITYPRLCRKTTDSDKRVVSLIVHSVHDLRPNKFLGTLKAHWNHYEHNVGEVAAQIKLMSVPCLGGASHPLGTTYLPTKIILAQLAHFQLDVSDLSILSLPDSEMDETTARHWQFLEIFGVGMQPDLEFYRRALCALSKKGNSGTQKIAKDIYESMAKLATVEHHDDLREYFDEEAMVLIDETGGWVSLSDCIWSGPDLLHFVHVLEPLFGNSPVLRNFFVHVLGIRNWELNDVFKEIERVDRRTRLQNLDIMSELRKAYAFLDANVTTDDDRKLVRKAFTERELVVAENGARYKLSNCLWRSPFPLDGFCDVSVLYPDLENFFVKLLKVKKASPSMLIDEVARMAVKIPPNIADIHARVVEIGMMLARASFDAKVMQSFEALKEVAWLPLKQADGDVVLVKSIDDFAIADNQRYRDAFSASGILLDFTVAEVHILHGLFQRTGLTYRYLSAAVEQVSTVDCDALPEPVLSAGLQAKAYALFCCAAKHKSPEALRDDRTLFDLLAEAAVFATSKISTQLVLRVGMRKIAVESDRSFIHHERADQQLKIYVPSERQQQVACYESQLPKLLAAILCVPPEATFDVSRILRSGVAQLDDVLQEQDIFDVSWIEKPVIELTDAPTDERPYTPVTPSAFGDSDSTTIIGDGAVPRTPRTPLVNQNATPRSADRPEMQVQQPAPDQYPRLVEQVVRSAQRTNIVRERSDSAALFTFGTPGRTPSPFTFGTPTPNEPFDHVATFGVRDANEFAHDRRIGAAGEAFVFERLSTLNLPDFTRENWQSTIRGELAGAAHYNDMESWVGRETADIVYTDCTGDLTRYFRSKAVQGVPYHISPTYNFAYKPITYYIEVKSTTSGCSTRFFMSGGQYKRMESMKRTLLTQHSDVYVIVRVYDLMTSNVGMKIFVDPMRFLGKELQFEAKEWTGKVM